MIVMLVGITCTVMAIILFYRQREKGIIHRLQQMIQRAAEGRYVGSLIDESTLSSLENDMNRFLSDSEVSSQNLAADKQKIQILITDISHQAITPISNVLLYVQLLEEKDSEKIYGEEILAIKDQTEKLNFLIAALVKISRLETGIVAVSVKRVKVNTIIEAVLKQIQGKALEKQVILESVQTEVDVLCDFKWTTEAICNIVDNAVKYTPIGGKVNIRIFCYQFFCKIDIVDNGMGIPEQEHNRIFGRFYRSSRVSEEEGVGIGLYLAREIIAAQNGYIKVSSELNKGATFSVYLPI